MSGSKDVYHLTVDFCYLKASRSTSIFISIFCAFSETRLLLYFVPTENQNKRPQQSSLPVLPLSRFSHFYFTTLRFKSCLFYQNLIPLYDFIWSQTIFKNAKTTVVNLTMYIWKPLDSRNQLSNGMHLWHDQVLF